MKFLEAFLWTAIVALFVGGPLITKATAENTAVVSAAVGQPAPDFTGTDVDGKTVKLSEFKGKNVVLEWFNPGCPYVVKHYDAGNMQAVQKAAVEKGAVWLSINSSAEGMEGNQTPADGKAYIAEKKSAQTSLILDPTGEIGRLYGAKTTPHMFVIDKDGKIAYAGAIDDKPSANPETVSGAKNYVLAALDELLAGKPVTESTTRPYGCSVKYKE